MDPTLLRAFNHQVWTQCQFASIAYDDLYQQLAKQQPPITATDKGLDWAVRRWYPVQSFLSAAASVSKALWGRDTSAISSARSSPSGASGR
jgi:hypothetical protein